MKLYKHLIFVFTALSTVIVSVFFEGCSNTTTVQEENETEPDTVKQEEEIVVYDSLTISNIDYDQMILDEKNGTYSFNIKATLDGPEKEKASVAYTIINVGADNSKTEIKSNNDGRFTDIPGLKEREIYIVEASVVEANDIKSEIRFFAETMPLVEPVKKLNATELTSIIMSYAKRDYSEYEANKDCIANDCKYFIDGGSETWWGTIIDNIQCGEWQSIEVISIEYDSFSRTSKVTIKIN